MVRVAFGSVVCLLISATLAQTPPLLKAQNPPGKDQQSSAAVSLPTLELVQEQPGKLLVIVNAKWSEATVAGYIWRVEPSFGVEKWATGGKLIFTGRPGEYRVECQAILWNAREIVTAELMAKIGDAPGPPPPPPPPGPDPTPTPVPPSLGELGKAAYAALTQVNQPAAEKAAIQRRLADFNKSHGAAVAAGAFKNAQEILDAWGEGQYNATGETNIPAWTPWANAMNAAVSAAVKAGKLRTNQQWAEAFRDIAAGLGA